MPRSAILTPVALALTAGSLSLLTASCSQPAQAQSSKPPTVDPLQGVKAFPGALGYGSLASGGRGGRMIFVTTLADAGAGSLRNCLQARGRRTCVFRVNGTIRFKTPVVITNPHLTIAGQTAPGQGITISHAGGSKGRTPIVIKNTQNIIVRHIRVRTDRFGGSRGSEDDITIENSSHVIIDHVSASWARDEIINGYGDNNHITISNSIFAWGIPDHDKCALLASDPVDAQRLSFIGNICAHNGDRNPDINFPKGSCVEVVNNVFYNAESRFTEIWEEFGGSPVSLVGNTYYAGPNTRNHTVGIARDTRESKGNAAIYVWDNAFYGAFQEWSGLQGAIVDTPPCPLTFTPRSASSGRVNALATAGAFPRDSLDKQVVYEIRNKTGKIGAETRVIPAYSAATPYSDADEDGMDDGWEAANGANPGKFDPWGDANGNTVVNFDEFLDYRERTLGP